MNVVFSNILGVEIDWYNLFYYGKDEVKILELWLIEEVEFIEFVYFFK